MERSLNRAMLRAIAVAGMALLAVAGCSTPHAVPVDCDGELQPINARPVTASPPPRGGSMPGTERGP